MPQCPRQAGAALPAPFPLYISPAGLRQQGGPVRPLPLFAVLADALGLDKSAEKGYPLRVSGAC